MLRRLITGFAISLSIVACGPASAPDPAVGDRTGSTAETSVELMVAGQALLKIDPRTVLEQPFASVRPLVESADIGFTNFEMAVNPPGNACGMPENYSVIRGEPTIAPEFRPGNTLRPHAVDASVMELLASMNFRLMSLVNNHSWDLGRCGILATIEAADKFDVTHAGTGRTTEEATAPAFRIVKGMKIGLLAANTSDDEERHIVANELNGVWTGHPEDHERNLAAVRKASQQSDFLIFYHHFQLEDKHLEGLQDGEENSYGHRWVTSVDEWQTEFARDVIDAGASMYIGHGHRGFDGIEIYKGRPLIRQFGGLAYHGLLPEVGAYDGHFAWWGLLAKTLIEDGVASRMEFYPLVIDDGSAFVDSMTTVQYQSRRGTSELASGELAQDILRRFQTLSAEYGTDVVIEGNVGHVVID